MSTKLKELGKQTFEKEKVDNSEYHVITTYIMPMAVEVKINLPEGKILGFCEVANDKNAWICVSVLHRVKHLKTLREFFVLTDGSQMKEIGELGRFFGTYFIHNKFLHIFEKTI